MLRENQLLRELLLLQGGAGEGVLPTLAPTPVLPQQVRTWSESLYTSVYPTSVTRNNKQ